MCVSPKTPLLSTRITENAFVCGALLAPLPAAIASPPLLAHLRSLWQTCVIALHRGAVGLTSSGVLQATTVLGSWACCHGGWSRSPRL